jgi:hypothetical protein
LLAHSLLQLFSPLSVRYDVDGSTSEEDFGPCAGSAATGTGAASGNAPGAVAVATKWYWLDESAEEVVIKKKVRILRV